ncbi:hypothetical protein LCE32_13480 [Streptomyces sp. 7G]|uniref:hypothetical protein n=1 Tax=Streptomyces sp. 7G TaxID=2877241 RepID=UPI001CD77C28|nr:hypothetical protein [Streptomyces sp. 7G]
MRTAEATGTIELPEGITKARQGGLITVQATLRRPVAMGGGTHFTIRDNGKAMGFGLGLTAR